MARTLSRYRGRGRRLRLVRRGAALTELAICLPLLSIVTLGSIEAANGIYVRQKLVSVAYDLSRSATAHGDSTATIGQQGNTLFKEYGIKGGTYSFSPANYATANPGTQITVTVKAPMSKNSIGLTRLYGSVTATASVTMTKS